MPMGISSPNFFRRRDELWSTYKIVIARILTYPNCTYTVSWRKFIRNVVLGYSLRIVIRQLPLLREEFWIPTLTFHSDLRRGGPHIGLCHALLVYYVIILQSGFDTYFVWRTVWSCVVDVNWRRYSSCSLIYTRSMKNIPSWQADTSDAYWPITGP